MALFGDDSASYVTPDGRTVTLPSQIAAQFPGLMLAGGAPSTPSGPPTDPGLASIGPAPGGAPPAQEIAGPPGPGAPPIGDSPVQLPAGGAPNWTPSDQAGLAALTPPPAPLPAPASLPPAGGPVTSPSQAGDGGPPNSLAPGPASGTPTQAQLAKYTDAQRVAGDSGALDEKATAIKQAGTAEADKAATIGNFQSQVADEAARQTAARAKLAQDMEMARQKRLDDVVAYAQKIQNEKIDRESDHPVIAQIGVILGALGQTLSRSNENMGLKAMYAAIDRKVAGQMQNLDQRRANLSTMRDQYGMQKELDRDRLADEDAHRIAYLDDAAKKMTAMGTQLESPIAKANMQSALADIAQKRQDVIGNAADRIKAQQMAAQARQDRLNSEAASRAVTTRGQTLEDRRFYYGQQQQEKEHMATLSAQLLERGDKVAADRAKRVGELGVIDPSTGIPLLTPAGQTKMAQADQQEAAARRATDPAQVQALTSSAQQLRDSAHINDAALAPTTKGAENANKIMAETTNAQKNIDAAREMLEAGPSAFDKNKWAQITVALEGVKVNYAQTLGEKMSPKALEAIDSIVGIDPNDSSMWGAGGIGERGMNKGKAIAALGAIETQLKSGASTALLANGIQTPWSPARPLDSAEDGIGTGTGKSSNEFADFITGSSSRPAGQTADEAARDAEPGGLQRIGGRIIRPFGGYDSLGIQDDAFDQASQAPGTDKSGRPLPPSNYGIDPADDAKVRAKIAESAKVGNKKYGQIIETLAQPLLSDRPGLAAGVARLIRDEDPKLLSDLISHVAASPGGGEMKANELQALVRRPAISPAIDIDPNLPNKPPTLPPPLQPGELASPPPPQPLPLSLDVLKRLTPAQQSKYKAWLDANGFLPAEQVR